MTLFGQDGQARAFVDALDAGRMHHAWLLGGPRGVGKASFAHAAALRLLAGAGQGLAVPDPHPTRSLLAAGSHPDFRLLERGPRDPKLRDKPRPEWEGEERARNITVDQVRKFAPLFESTPALSPWRAVVVDSIDDLEPAAANALLKSLEEPPPRCVFLLVSHVPARLLPTIRSRCRPLRFGPLDDADMSAAIRGALPDANAREVEELVAAGEGAPGLALERRGLGVPTLEAELDKLVAQGDATNALRSALSSKLATKAAAERYALFLDLAPRRVADEAKSRSGPALVRALEIWDRASALAARARPLSLDPAATVFVLAGYLAALAPPKA